MKLTVNRDLLLKALRRCTLPTSNTGNPVLACVALYPKRIPDQPGGLDLRTTNGLLGVATMIASATDDEEPLAVNCKALATMVGSMAPGCTLTLHTKGDPAGERGVQLIVSSGNRRMQRQARPVADVRPVPEPDADIVALKIPAKEFLAALERVSFVVPDVGQEHTFRRGIYIDVRDAVFNTVVTGDHQVAHYTSPLKLSSEPWHQLLPDLAVAQARDLATADPDGTITLCHNEHYIWIESSSTLLAVNPPPTEYHDWRHLLGSVKYLPVCRLPRLALIDSLKAMLATSTSSFTSMWVRILPDATIRLDYAAKDGEAEFHDTLPVSGLETQTLPTFLMQAEYLLHALDAANIDPVLQLLNVDNHIALTTEEGFFWSSALQRPDTGEAPPPLDPPVAAAAPDAAKKPRAGRQPLGGA